MILIAILDGLRPDLVTPQSMPYLYAGAMEGVWCTDSHCAFPTATRVNSASLSTGCYPGRHGLVGNELYSRAIDPYGAISCADWRCLQALADAEGERLLATPTLAETLRDAGRCLVCVGSGSPGTTYLTNPTVTGPVVNWATAWPPETEEWLEERLSGFLSEETGSLERTDFVLRALCDHLVPRRHPDVVLAWITEPDHTQHAHGLGTPEALATLHEVDRRLEHLVRSLTDAYDAEPDCLVTSDHGFSSVTGRIPLDEEVAALRGMPGLADLRADEAVFAGSGLYLHGDALERMPLIVGRLAERPWLGALSVPDEWLHECPGSLAHSAIFCQHPRAPHIMLSGSWDDGVNACGVPGLARSASGNPATHGGAGPYDVRNLLAGWGPRLKRGLVSDVPCGIVDLAPTVLHMLGLEPTAPMDGRVLHEVLRDGLAPETLTVEPSERNASPGGRRRQVIHYSTVAGRRYLDRITITQ